MMSKYVQKNMSPHDMANCFSNRNSYSLMETSKISLKDYEPFLSQLPSREQDLIDMYYSKGKKQKEIAEFFGVTQGAISHRLSRAIKRLEFLRDMPKLNENINNILGKYFKPFEIDLMKFMISTTCQSKTAKLLNIKYELTSTNSMTQVKVRHKFDRCLQKVAKYKRHNKDLKICHELLKYTKENLYMLHEVVLPHFNKGYRVKYE